MMLRAGSPMMLRAGYVVVFALAAVGCALAAARASDIAHRETRIGLLGLLVTSGVWAGAQAAHLLVPTESLSVGLYVVGLVFGFGTVFAWLYFCSAYTGESYHRKRPYRVAGLVLFLSVVVLKLTNPLHGQYFRTIVVSTPFQHVVVRQLPLYWATTVLAYALSAVGLYMLFRLFTESNVRTTGLGGLVSLTVLPVVFDTLGYLPVPWILQLNYEPLGVAAFSIGALFLTYETFEQVRWSGNRQVLDSLDEAVIVVDEDGRVRDANAAARSLFPDLSAEFGRPLVDVLPETAESAREANAATDDPEERVLSLERDGEMRHYLVSTTPLTLGPHRVGRAVVYADVTRVERQRRTLQRQHQQLDGFAAAVSHELRNLLAITDGYTSAAADALGSADVDAASDAVQSVEEATDRMIDVVGDLAMLARLSRTVDDPERLDFRATVGDVWTALDAPDVTLELRGEGTVVAEPERFAELVRNAAQLASATDAETLAVELADDALVLETDGEGFGHDSVEGFFEYGAAVPSAESGMFGPNIQALARAHGWTVEATGERASGIRLRIEGAETDAD